MTTKRKKPEKKSKKCGTCGECSCKSMIMFTDAELRCILDELSKVGWQREKFYDERRSVIAKLRNLFPEEK